MRNSRIWQLVLVLFCLILGLYIFIEGKNDSTVITSDENIAELSTAGGSAEVMVMEQSESLLDSVSIEVYKNLRNSDAESDLKELVAIFDSNELKAAAGLYQYQLAESTNAEADWMKAGTMLTSTYRIRIDSTMYDVLSSKSIAAFEKVLEMNPSNLDAKAEMAVSIIEGQNDVMKGVGLLKEIEQVDSNNTKALFYLGVLSMRSQQFPKAEYRFEKLVELDRTRGNLGC